MQMAVEKPDKRLHLRIEGVFNANVFSVLAVHIESEMIIFTSELQQGFRLFSQVNFAYDYAFVWKIVVLL